MIIKNLIGILIILLILNIIILSYALYNIFSILHQKYSQKHLKNEEENIEIKDTA